MKLFYLLIILIGTSCGRGAPEFVLPALRFLYTDDRSGAEDLVADGRTAMKERRLSLVYASFGREKFVFDIRSGDLSPTTKNADEFAADQKLPADPKSPERMFSFVDLAGLFSGSVDVRVGFSICHGYTGVLQWDAEKKIISKESFVVKCCF